MQYLALLKIHEKEEEKIQLERNNINTEDGKHCKIYIINEKQETIYAAKNIFLQNIIFIGNWKQK